MNAPIQKLGFGLTLKLPVRPVEDYEDQGFDPPEEEDSSISPKLHQMIDHDKSNIFLKYEAQILIPPPPTIETLN
jgi:hypothetical protein